MMDAMHDDGLSLSMFWAGALMAFTPLLTAAAVLGVWWRQRRRQRGAAPDAVESEAP